MPKAPNAYSEMLAGRGLKIGDQVVCSYRMPSAHQWWVAPLWVGVIEDADTDPVNWNARNSEAQFCVTVRSVRVRYLASGSEPGFTQHDSLGNLRKLEFGYASESPRFDSNKRGYAQLRWFAGRAGWMDWFPPAPVLLREVA